MNFYSLIFLCVVCSISVLGKRKRVIGGAEASIKNYPFVVSIRYKILTSHFCGGAIITPRHILTAAHCIFEKDFRRLRVYTGTNNITTNPGEEHEIEIVDVYPDFTGHSSPDLGSQHDIGIITLKEEIKIDRMQRPGVIDKEDLKPGEEVELVGWGQTVYPSDEEDSKQLHKASTKIITNKSCHTSIKLPIFDSHVCTTGSRKIGMCNADSGSPLIMNRKIVGVASFCIPCAKGYPDVFTRVNHYLDFIDSVINE